MAGFNLPPGLTESGLDRELDMSELTTTDIEESYFDYMDADIKIEEAILEGRMPPRSVVLRRKSA